MVVDGWIATRAWLIEIDKTNSFQVIPLKKYKKWVLEYLSKPAIEIKRARLIKLFKIA